MTSTVTKVRFRWFLTVLLLLIWTLGTITVHGEEATPFTTLDLNTIPDSQAPEYGPVQANASYRLALLVPYPDAPFWQAVQQAAATRAIANGVTLDIIALDTFSVPQQVEQIEQAISQGYDGILLGAIDAIGVVPAIISANTAGIPVLALDTEPAGGEIVSLICTDDVAAGNVAAQVVANAIDAQGTILNLQGDLDHPIARDRDAGLRSGLVDYPALTLLAESAHWSRIEATITTQGYLVVPTISTPEAESEADPDFVPIDAVFAANDQMTLGALDAIRENGTSEIVVGFGETTEILDAVKAGTLTAAIAEQPRRMGTIAIDVLVRHINGERVPPMIDSGVAVVTSATVDQARESF